MLKDSDYLVEFIREFTPVATRKVIDRDMLRRRWLLCLVRVGHQQRDPRIVATGEHGESEAAPACSPLCSECGLRRFVPAVATRLRGGMCEAISGLGITHIQLKCWSAGPLCVVNQCRTHER